MKSSRRLKRRVLDAINELNYNPEHMDGSLPGKKTNVIAVVTAYLNSFSFYEVYLINGFEKMNGEMGRKYHHQPVFNRRQPAAEKRAASRHT